MALHVVLLQGLGALTNDATAKLWGESQPSSRCHQTNRPSLGQRREGLDVERPPFCPWGAQTAGVFSCIYKCRLVRLQHLLHWWPSPRPVGSTLWGFHPGLSVVEVGLTRVLWLQIKEIHHQELTQEETSAWGVVLGF